MIKLNRVLTDVEGAINKLLKEANKPLRGILEFLNKHKKLILAIGVVIFIFKYLFNEGEGKEQEE